jgi:hypothetical protein
VHPIIMDTQLEYVDAVAAGNGDAMFIVMRGYLILALTLGKLLFEPARILLRSLISPNG